MLNLYVHESRKIRIFQKYNYANAFKVNCVYNSFFIRLGLSIFINLLADQNYCYVVGCDKLLCCQILFFM